MHMLVFSSPHPFITPHPIDIHLGAFSTPPLIATPPLIYFETFFQPPRLLPPPLLFRTEEYLRMSLYHISLKVLCLQAHITEHIYSCKLEWGVMYRLIQVTYDPVLYLASSCVMC